MGLDSESGSAIGVGGQFAYRGLGVLGRRPTFFFFFFGWFRLRYVSRR